MEQQDTHGMINGKVTKDGQRRINIESGTPVKLSLTAIDSNVGYDVYSTNGERIASGVDGSGNKAAITIDDERLK